MNIKIGHTFASSCDWPLSISFFLVNIFCDSPLKQGICMIHQRETPFSDILWRLAWCVFEIS